MSTLVLSRPGPVEVAAPLAGRVRFAAPTALCGELEVFAAGDAVAVIEDARGTAVVLAPANGFVVGRLVEEGARVERGNVLLRFSATS